MITMTPHGYQCVSNHQNIKLNIKAPHYWPFVTSWFPPRWTSKTLQWRNNERNGVLNTGASIVCSTFYSSADKKKHIKAPRHCRCEWNSPGTGEFPAWRARKFFHLMTSSWNAESVSISWYHMWHPKMHLLWWMDSKCLHSCRQNNFCNNTGYMILIPNGFSSLRPTDTYMP